MYVDLRTLNMQLAYVYYVSLAVDHDIAIVSILDLQYVTSDRISCHGLNEVQASALELHSVFATVFSDKEIEEIVDFGSAHLIS